MDGNLLIEFLGASIRVATPLLFVAIGGLISEKAGTFAVGIEGMMLAGAFGGAVATMSRAWSISPSCAPATATMPARTTTGWRRILPASR